MVTSGLRKTNHLNIFFFKIFATVRKLPFTCIKKTGLDVWFLIKFSTNKMRKNWHRVPRQVYLKKAGT